MLNYETLLSSYDDKLTLLQWLKKVEAALKDASAVSFKVNKKGDATLTFSIVFEDGSEIESGEIVLQQGESVESAAIVNGHLILTLTNGDELDAGVLFSGNVNISGNMAVTGKITGAEIVEDMAGYAFEKAPYLEGQSDYLYAGVVKNGNKLTLTLYMKITPADTLEPNIELGNFVVPAAVYNKLIPTTLGSDYAALDVKYIPLFTNLSANPATNKSINLEKRNSKLRVLARAMQGLTAGTTYLFRYEATFLLSDNLAA